MHAHRTHMFLCSLVVMAAVVVAAATGSVWALIPLIGCGLMVLMMVAEDRGSHHG